MCGIAAVVGNSVGVHPIEEMIRVQHHRGPDAEGIYADRSGVCLLGHNRLSIIDLSDAGSQPMVNTNGRLRIVLNGEIYNYLELRLELEAGYEFRSNSDTEVLLAAYEKWGKGCLDRLIGMFAFIVWDEVEQTAFVARDRFGVKPLYYHEKNDGTLLIASEIKALHAAGARRETNDKTWANYLTYGLYDHSAGTFWRDVYALPAGHYLIWKNNWSVVRKWYDIADRIGDGFDQRSHDEVEAEYFELMKDSVRLRFRSDVPVGINLSGGLDSSTLLGLVHSVQGGDSDVKAFTFTTGDTDYDELPWVKQMLAKTSHSLIVSGLTPQEVPALAADVQFHQDEPFGGLPTLAYAKLFDKARESGVTVLLDGNGMDEQWAGYDYYQPTTNGHQPGLIQGMKDLPVRAECLTPEFRALAEPLAFPHLFSDKLRNLQYRDTQFTKIPRALRFNDRISMRSSTELREPFLDHRLFELAMRQPMERKLEKGIRKKMLRDISARFIPSDLTDAPKRPLQTPQREWLRGPLAEWADDQIEAGLHGPLGSSLDADRVRRTWKEYRNGAGDNSFYIWQWISLGLAERHVTAASR